MKIETLNKGLRSNTGADADCPLQACCVGWNEPGEVIRCLAIGRFERQTSTNANDRRRRISYTRDAPTDRRRCAAGYAHVKFVLFDGEVEAKLVTKLQEVRRDVQVFSVAGLRERGQKLREGVVEEEVKRRRPIKETVAAVHVLLGHHLTPEDAYLPLAHILEFIVEIIMLFVGMPTGFGGVKISFCLCFDTLTDTSVCNCDGDIKAFRPSIMVGVPAVWEMIRKGIIGQAAKSGKLKESVFKGAVGRRSAAGVGAKEEDAWALGTVHSSGGGRKDGCGGIGGACVGRVATNTLLSLTAYTRHAGAGKAGKQRDPELGTAATDGRLFGVGGTTLRGGSSFRHATMAGWDTNESVEHESSSRLLNLRDPHRTVYGYGRMNYGRKCMVPARNRTVCLPLKACTVTVQSVIRFYSPKPLAAAVTAGDPTAELQRILLEFGGFWPEKDNSVNTAE
ncbi:hypothetical protein C8R45DRAFT_934390 [Mycena sanguinolenta]|nr:hypothetical protein C8R45DRAFT_934390 [Mycena sanguinolenta]